MFFFGSDPFGPLETACLVCHLVGLGPGSGDPSGRSRMRRIPASFEGRKEEALLLV